MYYFDSNTNQIEKRSFKDTQGISSLPPLTPPCPTAFPQRQAQIWVASCVSSRLLPRGRHTPPTWVPLLHLLHCLSWRRLPSGHKRQVSLECCPVVVAARLAWSAGRRGPWVSSSPGACGPIWTQPPSQEQRHQAQWPFVPGRVQFQSESCCPGHWPLLAQAHGGIEVSKPVALSIRASPPTSCSMGHLVALVLRLLCSTDAQCLSG